MGGRGSGHKKGQFKVNFRTNKHARDYGDPLYLEWRKEIRQRDKSKCQMPYCNNPKSPINVHHIKPWAKFPSLRYERTNGICLCKVCHDRIKGQEQVYEPLLLQIALTNTQKWKK